MQVSHSYSQFKNIGLLLLKSAIVCFVIYFIVFESNVDFKIIYNQIDAYYVGVVLVVFSLTFLNWFLEAEKWRIAMPEENLGFFESLRLVLSGLAMNWVLPYAAGDLIVRVASMKDKFKASKNALIIRGMSLSITILFGCAAILFYLNLLNQQQAIWCLVLFSFLVSLVFFLLPNFQKYRVLFFITFLRYGLFTFQLYLLLINYADITASVCLLAIGWIFFFKTFTPGFLGKIGIREASGLVFFQSLGMQADWVLLPCVTIWMLNTVIPSLAGIALVFHSKFLLSA